MTQGELEKLSVPIQRIFSDLELRIMSDIVRRIKINGFSTASADWELTRLQQLGASESDIKKWIKEALEASNEEMERIFSDEVYEQYMGHERAYKACGAKHVSFDDNVPLQQLIEATKEQISGEYENLAASMGFAIRGPSGKITYSPLMEFYRSTLDDAVIDIQSGAFSYQVVLNRAINQMTASGMRWIDYDSGHHNRVDVAVRRAVMTGFRQVQGKINEQVANDLRTDSYEVSWHRGARPEHQVWQGKVYTMQELVGVCGLGTVTGLHGANCYHDYIAFIPGVSVRTYTDEWLEEQNQIENTPKKYLGKEYTTYEALQHQRQLETLMRKYRQDIKLLQEGGGLDEAIVLKKAKYRGKMQEYEAFSKSMGLPLKKDRIYQDGLGNVSPGKNMSEKTIKEVKHRLSSTASYKLSLEYVRIGKAGLSKSRKALLSKIPEPGNWIKIKKGKISTKDIAFLSAYTKHEFAIWESKQDVILCHGTQYHCDLPDKIYDLLLSGKYRLIAHTHVDLGELVSSPDDRRLLKTLGQKKSKLVSIDGREVEFSTNMFAIDEN